MREALLDANRPPFGEDQVRALAVAVLLAVGHLHDLGVVHRDIAASNVLYADRVGGTPVLADFDFCCFVGEDGTFVDKGASGTPGYVCPEVLGGAAR